MKMEDQDYIFVIMQDVEVIVESGHEFKHPSEVDPIKRQSKGGFLEGHIQLPLDLPDMRVRVR